MEIGELRRGRQGRERGERGDDRRLPPRASYDGRALGCAGVLDVWDVWVGVLSLCGGEGEGLEERRW
jgi:hypothetical protein